VDCPTKERGGKTTRARPETELRRLSLFCAFLLMSNADAPSCGLGSVPGARFAPHDLLSLMERFGEGDGGAAHFFEAGAARASWMFWPALDQVSHAEPAALRQALF